MNLVLLGHIESAWLAQLKKAIQDWPAQPTAVYQEPSPPLHQPPLPYSPDDLWLLISPAGVSSHEPTDCWRTALIDWQIPFQMGFSASRSGIENLKFAWSRHARSSGGQRPEIKPRYKRNCENCSDPDCEHQLFSAIKLK